VTSKFFTAPTLSPHPRYFCQISPRNLLWGGGDMNPGEMGGDEIDMTGKKRKVGIKIKLKS